MNVSVRNVWNMFKMNTMNTFYFKTGVLLLTDVFEKFINTGLEYYRLNPFHYFRIP